MRLRKLEEVAERKAYDELVKDITPRKGVEEPFSSYKDQLGFGQFLCFACSISYLSKTMSCSLLMLVGLCSSTSYPG